MKEKGFTHLLLLLVGIVFIGGYLLYLGVTHNPIQYPGSTSTNDIQDTPTQAPTSTNWETYTSTTGSFSLQYPSSWSKEINYSQYDEELSIKNKEYIGNVSDDLDSGVVSIRVAVLPSEGLCGSSCKNVTREQFYDRNNILWKTGDIGGGGSGTTVVSVTDTSLSGKAALFVISHPTSDYEFSSKDDITYYYYAYLGGENNEVFTAQYTVRSTFTEKERLLEEVKSILSTLKFRE